MDQRLLGVQSVHSGEEKSFWGHAYSKYINS